MGIHYPEFICSGAQMGADRGGLIAAAILGYDHGGYVPKGRKAEDGTVPSCYPMTETKEKGYATRTKLNVECSDATLIFSYETDLTGGTALTERTVKDMFKPGLIMTLERGATTASNRKVARRIRQWLAEKKPRTLNIAGPRESKAEGIQSQVAEVMLLVLQTKATCICGRSIPEKAWATQVGDKVTVGLKCSACKHTTHLSDFAGPVVKENA